MPLIIIRKTGKSARLLSGPVSGLFPKVDFMRFLAKISVHICTSTSLLRTLYFDPRTSTAELPPFYKSGVPIGREA